MKEIFLISFTLVFLSTFKNMTVKSHNRNWSYLKKKDISSSDYPFHLPKFTFITFVPV